MPSIRAFRGTRRSSVYREHVLADEAFRRILEAARREGFTLVASLAPGELDKAAARRLAEQVTGLRASAALPDLDDDLTSIAEVARWCGRAAGRAWLTIEEG